MRNAVKIYLLLMLFSNSTIGQTFFERNEFSVELLPLINSAGSEISPAIVKNELFFSAVRDEFIGREQLKEKNRSFYDVYFTETDDKGYPLVLRRLVPGFGNLYHEGPVAWCEATGELFVTLSQLPEGDSYLPKLSRENIKLRLVIMREVDEEWTVVEDLPFNQDNYNFAHPAISVSGDTLIFSSDMNGGYGNSDLYMVVRTEGTWSEPQNLGDIINSPGNEMFPAFGPDNLLIFSSDAHEGNIGQLDLYYTTLGINSQVTNLGEQVNSLNDDFGLVIHSSHQYGYFSSNRQGKGSDDIYRIELVSLFETIRGTVLDIMEMPVPDANIQLQDCNGNNLQSTQTDPDGRFRFEVLKGQCYQAVATKPGYDSDLKPYYLENSVLLNIEQQTRYQIYVVDIENEEPIPEADINCDELQWLTDGFGYATIDSDTISSCDLRISANEYFTYVIEADPYRFSPGDHITDTVRLYEKELNKSYLIDNIIFFLDKWRLLPESERQLDKLIKLMKDNPSLKVELASHTDSRGEAQYNEWLSQKRSDSATDYMVENGIPKERIVSKGYGESQLINHCANGVPCSEAEHLENRRTEFTILAF